MAKSVTLRRGGTSAKTPVIEHLYESFKAGRLKDGIVYSDDIVAAIDATGANLSKSNPANFLKDLVRKKSVVDNWPESLTAIRISARQRYGYRRVFEFFEHPAEWESPFPDWHSPDEDTPVYTVQSVSMDSLARSLGRTEESWLTQIAVNLHLVHTQLSLFSPVGMRSRVRDVRHLQMGLKTQPEIDAAFIASYRSKKTPGATTNVFITLEAKQRDERILVDQIREQVAKAFEITAHLTEPPVHAIKPMALQVVSWEHRERVENMMFIVEFEHIGRKTFDAKYAAAVDPLAIYDMELKQVSATLYRFEPPFPALG